MSNSQFDLVMVGGGLGASALAIAMARRGAKVLVLEKETQFRDRVRGECIVPWGVEEARQLGIADVLLKSCAKELPWIDMGFGPRNLLETTPQKAGCFSFCHPEMQEALLAEAARSGAEVRRGVVAKNLEGGTKQAVVTVQNGREERIAARFVVAADGRGSAARKWVGLESRKQPHPFHFAGVLLTGVSGRDDMASFIFNPLLGLLIGIIPETKQRCRAYLGYPTNSGLVLQGDAKLKAFLAEAQKVSPTLGETCTAAESIGPLASFDTAESWVEHPYRDGVALIGDAAGTSDPSFGQGMSSTLRDVRVLRDALLSHSDWDQAGHAYARQHDIYIKDIYKVSGWMRTLFQDPSPESELLRQRAMPKIAEDLTRVADHILSGPELPSDEAVRSRMFGES